MSEFLLQLKKLFPQVLVSETDFSKRILNCEGINNSYLAVARPRSEKEIIDLVSFLYKSDCPFYAISAGHNWGYGTSQTTTHSSILIDLSLYNHVVSLDEEIGLVEIQSGVNQAIFAEYLNKNESKWMVPLTGAGPTGSILGNALEKGFGLNPVCDHFLSLISLKVLLPNGEIYQSSLKEMGAEKSDLVSKWKIGPYIEGLFAQSNLGIVLSAWVELAPRPNEVSALLVKCSESELPRAIEFCQNLRYRYYGVIGAINISNKDRIASTISFNQDVVKSKMSELLYKISDTELADYQIIIPLLEFDKSFKSVHRSILKMSRQYKFKSLLLSENYIGILLRIINFLSFDFLNDLKNRIGEMGKLINLIKGNPNSFALKIAYSGNEQKFIHKDPALDRIGLLWFAPILALKTNDFLICNAIFDEVLPKYNQKKFYTYTNFDQKLVEATIPLYFDLEDSKSQNMAYQCWFELYEKLKTQGIIPYRFSINMMDKAFVSGSIGQKIVSSVKKQVDPKNLFAKERYTFHENKFKAEL